MHAYFFIVRRPNCYNTLEELEKLKADKKLDVHGPFEIYGVADAILEARQVRDIPDLYRRFVSPIVDLRSVGSCETYVAAREMPEKELRNEYDVQGYVACDVMHPTANIEEAQEEIYRVDEVQRSDIVLGPYDVIARIACQEEDFGTVVSEIQRIPAVLRTISFIIARIPRRVKEADGNPNG